MDHWSENTSFYKFKSTLKHPMQERKNARTQERVLAFLLSCSVRLCDCKNAKMQERVLAFLQSCTFVLAARMVMHSLLQVNRYVPDTRHFVLKVYLLHRYSCYKNIEHTNYHQTKHTPKIQFMIWFFVCWEICFFHQLRSYCDVIETTMIQNFLSHANFSYKQQLK